jgi:hypothetical protein
LGEQAEHQLVDEIRDAALVVLPAQRHGDLGEIGRCLRGDLSRVAVGSKRS